jgi:hypothetical protein
MGICPIFEKAYALCDGTLSDVGIETYLKVE